MPEPKVSIVTPVFNGERYLAEAIESVLAQTYSNWDYVIADNRSSDRTLQIAAGYARRDPRIRVVAAGSHLPIIANWNRALRQLSPDSEYCKVLHADDRLFPECLARMVEVMERHPTVGLVGAYVLRDRVVECDGLPPFQTVFSGRAVCRDTLLDRCYVFGSPTSTLLRSAHVRAKDAEGFYNEQNLHADFEVCYEILEHHDFGFVHQVLTYTRTHPDSMGSTFSRFYNPQLVEYLGMMRKYGPRFLDAATYEARHAEMLKRYRRLIARRILAGRGLDYWRFHRSKLAQHGYRMGIGDLARGAAEEALRLVTRPGEALRLGGRGAGGGPA